MTPTTIPVPAWRAKIAGIRQRVDEADARKRQDSIELDCAVNTVRYWMLKAGFQAKSKGYEWVSWTPESESK